MTKPIDLRSDTVTSPGPGMRKAIAAADVGDDVLDRDPTVACLELRVSELLGKQAALFVPSGTMANLIALRLHADPGTEVVAERGSHVVNFEAGSASAVAGVGFRTLEGVRGVLDPEDVRGAVRPASPHVPQTSLIWIENTHLFSGGSVWPLRRLEALGAVAAEESLPVHMDGARLWNAVVASGETPARLARCATTVSVSLSKGLGAPAGSLLVGPAYLVRQAWILRKQLGGAMRQAGILAAAALYGLDHHLARLVEDHVNARRLAERLAGIPGVKVDLQATQTNILFFDVAGTGRSGAQLVDEAGKAGVRLIPFGGGLVRAVTHLDVSGDDVERAGDVLAALLAPRSAGAPG